MPATIINIGAVYLQGCPAPHLQWHVGPVTLKESPLMPLELTITNEQQCTVHVQPITPAGNPAPVDGAATWTVQEGACMIVLIDDTSATIVSGDTPGDSVILVSADADVGEGVQTIMDTILVHVEGAMATQLGLSADAPVLKT